MNRNEGGSFALTMMFALCTIFVFVNLMGTADRPERSNFEVELNAK